MKRKKSTGALGIHTNSRENEKEMLSLIVLLSDSCPMDGFFFSQSMICKLYDSNCKWINFTDWFRTQKPEAYRIVGIQFNRNEIMAKKIYSWIR